MTSVESSASGDSEYHQKSVERFRLAPWMEQYDTAIQMQRQLDFADDGWTRRRTIKKAHEDALTFGVAVPPRRERKRTTRVDDSGWQVAWAVRETQIMSHDELLLLKDQSRWHNDNPVRDQISILTPAHSSRIVSR